MIITELPYVSDFLKETVVNNNYEVIHTTNAEAIFKGLNPNFVRKEDVIASVKNNLNQKIFTNSENAISWIINNLGFTDLPRQIELFKNKVKFRELMKQWHPNYFFKDIAYTELEHFDISQFPKTFIIKPAVGFFSMGVYIVNEHAQWHRIVKAIQNEVEQIKSIYPVEVFNPAQFIAEEIILGDEYAFDAYYTQNGEPVILNIYHHPFASGNDVSDRVYLTSELIVRNNIDAFTAWLYKIGKEVNLYNFPLHVEVRVDATGNIQPIEINPLRFGGFCTTADCTWFAYGVNSYNCFFDELKPDWDSIFEARKNKLYSLLVLNNSTGIEGNRIRKFNYDKIAACLEMPLEIRSIDFEKFPLFGFVFTETRADNFAELQYLLQSDLKEFIELY